MKIFIRTPYNYDTNLASDETGLNCLEPTMAQQQFKDECDINHILKTFGITGEIPQTDLKPLYGDFTGSLDYHHAQNQLIASQQAFMALDAKTRAYFDNSIANLMDFMENPNNREKAIELGLVNAPPSPLKEDAQLPT